MNRESDDLAGALRFFLALFFAPQDGCAVERRGPGRSRDGGPGCLSSERGGGGGDDVSAASEVEQRRPLNGAGPLRLTLGNFAVDNADG